MAKNFMDKFKEGVSVKEMEDFARKYTLEVFTIIALVIGSISSMYDYFTGPKLTLFFLAIGVILGILFPAPVEKGLRQFYSFTFKQEKMTQIIIGVVKLIVALFIPFIFFGMVGLLAGTSYHYYTRHAQIMGETKSSRPRRPASGDEHD